MTSLDLFKEFLTDQKHEIEKYKWIESQKAGYDLGNDAVATWIRLYAADFRLKWFKSKTKVANI